MLRKRQKFNSSKGNSNWSQWLVVLVVLVVLIGSVGMWFEMKRDRKWNGTRRLTLAVIDTGSGNQVSLFSIQPEANLVWVDLAGSVKMRVARGYGYYLMSALYGLASQENNFNLITETLTQELGVPVDGWVVGKFKMQNSKCKTKEYFIDNKDECLIGFTKEWWWDRQTQSSMSRGDRLAIWWAARNMGYDDFKKVDFTQGQWARQTRDIDGFPQVEFDKNATDIDLPELLTDTRLRAENLQARIVNTVPVGGLGSQVARIVNGLGVKVVEVRNSTGGLGQCVIQTRSEQAESLSVKRLMEVFDCKLDLRELDDRRADIELRVGYEQARAWMGESK